MSKNNGQTAKASSRFTALAARMAAGLQTPEASPPAEPLHSSDIPTGGLMSGLTEASTTREAVIAAGKYREVPLDLVDFDPYQPRKTIDEDGISDLATQIEAAGMLHLPIVRPNPKSAGRYMVVCGERRVRAHKLLERQSIEVRFENWDDAVTRAAQIVENNEHSRKNVKAWEEATALADLERMVGSQTEIARVTGLTLTHVSKRMALMNLPSEIRELLADGIISDGEAAYDMGTLWKHSKSAALDLIARGRRAGRIERAWIRLELRSLKSRTTLQENGKNRDAIKNVSSTLDSWLSRVGTAGQVRGSVGVVGKQGRVRLELQFESAEEAEAFLTKL